MRKSAYVLIPVDDDYVPYLRAGIFSEPGPKFWADRPRPRPSKRKPWKEARR